METIQKIGVTAFILRDGRVLVLKRSQKENFLPDFFELPGGKINFGENPIDALVREIKEETNLDIKVVCPYSVFSYVSSDNQRHTVDIQFIAMIKSDVKNLKLSSEHDLYRWIKKEELENLHVSDLMKKAIIDGFEYEIQRI